MDLRELYQEVILDHNKRPRNKGRLENPTHHADGYNPLCGDMVVIDVDAADGTIADIRFDGQGCAISTASASLMTEAVKGKTIQEAEKIFKDVQAMFTGQDDADACCEIDELMALSGVKEYPVRIKCAVLPWHALHSALTTGERVKTE